MRRRPTFSRRPSLRESLESSKRGQDFYAAMAGKPSPANEMLQAMGPKRSRAPSDPNDSEAPVIAAVGELLAVHPQVLLAVRQNSGAMHYQAANGNAVPVWFYRLVKKPFELTFTDYWGFLKDFRPFAIECKRPSWKEPRTDRETKQLSFIRLIEGMGGIGGFVRSSDEAKGLLP